MKLHTLTLIDNKISYSESRWGFMIIGILRWIESIGYCHKKPAFPFFFTGEVLSNRQKEIIHPNHEQIMATIAIYVRLLDFTDSYQVK